MKDYIIVGFGLAGMAIAHELEKRKKSFVIFDEGKENASKVAAGIINPLILKRFTKAWKADLFISKAERVYRELQNSFDLEIFQPTLIYRKIKSVREQNDWFHASDKKELHLYMDDELQQLKEIQSPFKYGKVNHSSILDTEKLLNGFKTRLQNKNQFIRQHFDYNHIEFQEEGISYNSIYAKKVIFCEGIGLQQNPFFNNLPIIGNKGEFLIVKIPDLEIDVIIKTALALVPLGDSYYKFGATYSRDYQDKLPEQESKEFLIHKLEEIIDVPYDIIDTKAGIRPTVIDRRPLLGKHPDHPNLLICNGFGSHGIMMAPTLAEWLLNFDINGSPLSSEVDIQRHYK